MEINIEKSSKEPFGQKNLCFFFIILIKLSLSKINTDKTVVKKEF